MSANRNTKNTYTEGVARVINIKDYAGYQAKLSKIVEQVSDLAEEIYESLFELAVLNKWKHWSDSQPVGTEFDVDEEMLRNTGDKNIDVLWKLLDTMLEVKENIKLSPPCLKSSEKA